MYPTIVHNDLITYKSEVTTMVPTPTFPTTSVAVESSSNLTANNKAAALLSDITGTPALTVGYISGAFTTPGSGNLTITAWTPLATKLTKDNNNVVALTDGTFTGTGLFTVSSPATNPAGAADTVPTYPFSVKITASQSILNSN